MTKLFTAIICFLSISANVHAEYKDAQELISAFNAEYSQMTQEERDSVAEGMEQIRRIKGGTLVQKISTASVPKGVPFVCVGIQAAIAAGGKGLQCASANLKIFTIHTLGIHLALVASANVAIGFATDEFKTGAYPVHFTGGGYWKVGGSVMVAGPLVFLAPGVGFGGHLNFGVQDDSLFGGQLNIDMGI